MGFLIWLLGFLSPYRRRVHHYRKVGPAEFLALLRTKKPGRLTVDRIVDDEEVGWRISFASARIAGDELVTDHFTISFSEHFVPYTFRRLVATAVWGPKPDSAWSEQSGTVKNPAAKIG